MAAILKIRGITKTYPGVRALQDVSFDVEQGTIHAIMGENGAGKSTLMQIIAGAQRPDSGNIEFGGHEMHFANPAQAQAAGIAIVYQELNLSPNLSVAENIFLGMEPVFGINQHRLGETKGVTQSRYAISSSTASCENFSCGSSPVTNPSRSTTTLRARLSNSGSSEEIIRMARP